MSVLVTRRERGHRSRHGCTGRTSSTAGGPTRSTCGGWWRGARREARARGSERPAGRSLRGGARVGARLQRGELALERAARAGGVAG